MAILARLRSAADRFRQLPVTTSVRKLAVFVAARASAPLRLRACQVRGRAVRTVGAPRVVNGGHMEVGGATIINSELAPVRLEVALGARLTIGAGCLVNYGATLVAARAVEVGDGVYIGPRSDIRDLPPGGDPAAARPVTLGAGCWIGQGAVVRPGSLVGAGAVVAAGSTVDGEVPPGVVVAGDPARPIKQIDEHADREAALPPPPGVAGPLRLLRDLLVPPARGALRALAALRAGSGPGIRTAWALRACDTVGEGTRVEGRLVVENLGRIEVAEGVRVSSSPDRSHLVTGVRGTLRLGRNVAIGAGCGLCAHDLIEVGEGSVFGPLCGVIDTGFHGLRDRSFTPRPRPIRIGKRVQLGARTLVMPGAVIGDGAVVEPGSVVSREIPAGVRAGGIPAHLLGPVGDPSRR